MKEIKKILPVLVGVIALHLLSFNVFPFSLPLKHFSARDGLPASFVTYILQDSRGYLWFGTEHGLSRFNGKEFVNIIDEKRGLKNDYIMAIFEDRKGNLWIGTRGEGLFRINAWGISVYTKKNGLPSDRVSAIIEDKKGILWIGTHAGLCLFDGRKFSIYTQIVDMRKAIIRDLFEDKRGNLWVATEKDGLWRFYRNEKNKELITVKYSTADGLCSNFINTLTLDHYNNMWIGTEGGLNYLQWEKEKPVFRSFTAQDGLSDNHIKTIAEDRDKNIWISTENGVNMYSSGRFTPYYMQQGFLSNNIGNLFEDKEGNIWFCTQKGVSLLQSLKITNFTVMDGLPDSLIWAIVEATPGKYWIATNNGLCYYSDGKTKNYTTKDGLLNNTIYNMMKDRWGNIWLAYNGGLGIYSPVKKKFRNYTTKDGLPDPVVLAFSEDRDGTVWIATTKGLCKFRRGRIEPHGLKIDMEPSAAQAILTDSKGNLWFSDTNGLWKISGEKSSYYTTENGLVGAYIYALFEDSRGKIWIGTKRGLSCYDNGKFTNYTKKNGLSDNDCQNILEDDNHNLWISTMNGVNRYDGRRFKAYTSRNGLLSDEMTHCSNLKDSQGILWFGTIAGISRFNTALDRINTVPPPVYITQFSVMGKNYPLVTGTRLHHQQNYIRFSFDGLSYTSPEDILYSYTLEGMDHQWYTVSENYISYPSLPPGTYVFKVIAQNNDGVKSVKAAEFGFTILPPFWNTWWFNTIVVTLVIFVGVLIIYFLNKRVKDRVANEAKNKQLIMAHRMKLMGVLAGGAVHDLKNLLSIILGYSELVHGTTYEVTEEEKNEAVDIIKSTADTAFQVVKQILAFSRQNYDEIRECDVADLLNEILSILKVTIPQTITLEWNPPEERIYLAINPVKFKQVVMNLCLNAVQAMGERGALTILLKKNETGEISITVSDTGPGIQPEYLTKIFEPLFTTKEEENGSGLGLFVVKQVVDEYGGKIHVQSNPGEGATFHISFPPQDREEINPY